MHQDGKNTLLTKCRVYSGQACITCTSSKAEQGCKNACCLLRFAAFLRFDPIFSYELSFDISPILNSNMQRYNKSVSLYLGFWTFQEEMRTFSNS